MKGRGGWASWALLASGAAGLGIALTWWGSGEDDPIRPAPPAAAPRAPAATPVAVVEAPESEVRRACASCHDLPMPDQFPRGAWPKEVERGFKFLAQSGGIEGAPSQEAVTAHYQARAPEKWTVPVPPPAEVPLPVMLERIPLRCRDTYAPFSVANARFARLFDDETHILACDMQGGYLVQAPAQHEPGPLKILASGLGHPARAEDCDLDGDGIRDLLIADLGVFYPSDNAQGRVIWLRGRPGRAFEAITLADGLGRVSDVRPADFDGDGDLDLIVAVFGWHEQGEILLLVNETPREPGAAPAFRRKQVDPRHGTIHVPVADLDGDGRMDFVAVISQEYETVEAFLNDGRGGFRRETLFAAGMPSFGSSGIRLADLDKDGDLDVILTNGDVLDTGIIRAEHGVHWLENEGSYPFKHRKLAGLYGACGVAVGDIDGDGDLDIAASSFLPTRLFSEERKRFEPDGIILLLQEGPGRFRKASLVSGTCLFPSCDLADIDGDGRLDLLAGQCDVFPPLAANHDWAYLWRNRGAAQAPPP